MTRMILIGVALLLSTLTTSVALGAEEVPQDYELRMEYIENSLEDNRKHSRYWQYGWASFFGASAATYTGLWLNSDDSDDSINYSLSALKSTLALGEMLWRPHPGRHGAELLRSLPENSPGQKSARLDYGEDVMRKSSERYTARRTWKPHLILIGVNAVFGGAIAAFGDEGDGAISAAVGIAMGEVKLWTLPSRPADDWREYKQAHTKGVSWQLVPISGGLALQGNF